VYIVDIATTGRKRQPNCKPNQTVANWKPVTLIADIRLVIAKSKKCRERRDKMLRLSFLCEVLRKCREQHKMARTHRKMTGIFKLLQRRQKTSENGGKF
jgi:hypothetical protein